MVWNNLKYFIWFRYISWHIWSYIVVLVVEVDNESKRPPSHRLRGDKRILKCGLTCRWNYGAKLKSSEVLDVELEILKGTKQNWDERSKISARSRNRTVSFFTWGYRKEASRDSTMKSSEPLLVKPSRNLTMLLAGKSEVIHSFSLNHEYYFYFCCQFLKRLGTFSFDKQNSGVSIGWCLHFSNQSFFFIFFFFCLQIPQNQLQLIPFNSYIMSHLNELWSNWKCFSDIIACNTQLCSACLTKI